MGSSKAGCDSRGWRVRKARGGFMPRGEYIFTAWKREKARKCEACVARASLAGKAAGGRDWRLGRWRFLEALDHSVSPSPPPFCSVLPGQPDGRRQESKTATPNEMRS